MPIQRRHPTKERAVVVVEFRRPERDEQGRAIGFRAVTRLTVRDGAVRVEGIFLGIRGAVLAAGEAGRVAALAVALAVAGATYLAGCLLLRVSEVAWLWDLVRRRPARAAAAGVP